MNKLESNSGVKMPLFLSTFKDKKDFEISSTICAWMSNGWRNEDFIIEKYILKNMFPTPYKYVEDYNLQIQEIDTYTTFFRLMTNFNFKNLIHKLQNVYNYYGSLETCFFNTLAYKRKSSYNHEIFADIFSGHTGFPTINSNCSFYRYNLLYYWLTYKHKVWERHRHEKALLPCDDMIFKNAYKKGITKILMKTNLQNAKILTKKAKEIYGNCDFFKLYEDLNSSNDD